MVTLSDEAFDAACAIYDARKRFETDMANFNEDLTYKTTPWFVEARPHFEVFFRSWRVDPDKVCPAIEEHGLHGPFLAHDDYWGERRKLKRLKSWRVWSPGDVCMTPALSKTEAQRIQFMLNWIWAISFGA
jgi:hypothetical protein